jgi:uncharacterized protein with NRDE domain
LCLIGLALDAHPAYALVIAANRDEYFERPAAPLDWWHPVQDERRVLSGRDLSAGGTWLGVAPNGRVAALTNVRDPARHRPGAPSRGALVPEWLLNSTAAETLWPRMAARECNPFNLLGGDLASGRWWWADDRSRSPRALGRGLYGLSNAALDVPWPKVQRLKQAMRAALNESDDTDALMERLFAALANRDGADDAALPDTGIGLERERWLAPAFIHMPDGRYGTRNSTVLVGVRRRTGWQLTLTERTFDADGAACTTRRADWAWRGAGGAMPEVRTVN